MANDFYSQMALAESPAFQRWVKGGLCKKALAVFAENPGTQARRDLAALVLDNPGTYATQWAADIATNTGISAFATGYDFKIGTPTTAAGDPDLTAVLNAEWDRRAGTV